MWSLALPWTTALWNPDQSQKLFLYIARPPCLSLCHFHTSYTHLPFSSYTTLCFLSSGLLHILFLLSKKHPSFPHTPWNSQAQITSQLQLHFLWEVPDHLSTSHLRKSDCPFVSSHSSLFFVFFIALRLFLITYLAIVSHLTKYGQNIKLFGSPLYFVNVYLV